MAATRSDKSGTLTLIAGCGYTGRRLARRLTDAGRPVLGLVASEESRSRLDADGIDARILNFDEQTAAQALPATGAAVYLVPPPREGRRDTRLSVFLDGLQSRPPQRLVYASTTGVYGDRGGATVDETTPIAPQSARSQRRADAEDQVRRWCEERGVAWLILRIPGIYGPGRLQLDTLASGRAVLREEDAGPGNRIHVHDLVRCLAAALETGSVDRVLNVGDGDHASNTRFVSEVARQLERPPPPVTDRETLQATVSERRWSFIRESRRVDTARMRRELGVTPVYDDHREGIAASLAEMAAGGTPAD